MTRWSIRAALLIAGMWPAGLEAQPVFMSKQLCKALRGIATEAHQSNSERHLTILAGRDVAWEFVCRSEKSHAEPRFCAAAFKAVGLEFKHTFPWYVDSCLRRVNVVPDEQITKAHVGFDGPGRIDHLAADLGRAHVDIRYVPDSEPAAPPDRRDYYGRYEMIVTPR